MTRDLKNWMKTFKTREAQVKDGCTKTERTSCKCGFCSSNARSLKGMSRTKDWKKGEPNQPGWLGWQDWLVYMVLQFSFDGLAVLVKKLA
ncbi:hypothetical protein HanXRQr2_Chr00c226g0834271 [Helianthus annuus]|uniref:Uncharacterized protein n=1 Tax=Helianthus annuus TaxID=4232 RepID=A0A251SJZ0_HELAN|nr:hypothetical protein HanXRQr2_Chr00c226g0834271 [Helianthus annuus]